MTVSLNRTGANQAYARQWESFDWNKAEEYVKRLQFRIAKASKENIERRLIM